MIIAQPQIQPRNNHETAGFDQSAGNGKSV